MKLLEKMFISCFISFIFALFYVSIPSICAQNVVLSDDKPTISVVGEAEKSIPVDQSKISLAVENTASDSGIARKNNAEKMNKIISILHTKGLTDKNMSTSNFEIRPNYDAQNNNYEKIISYTAINRISITTSSYVNISSFIDLAINNGVNRVESIEFVTSKKVINENFNELLQNAFNNAKQRAETLSTLGGFVIDGVKKIDIPQADVNTPSPSPPLPYAYSSNSLSIAQKTSTQILPQVNKLTVNLPITFYIKNNVR